ncbi:hypothetical protein F2Q69_00048758 [Brassica cretica]|uniref:Uncharacterized protein n=1 Tax=Brassica cretica TaxID=69181 RepID=A0A8S9Q2Z9_BRACR|nr:hypothetical protein F2Q69_00048758 [Brassica cretica]
MTAYRFICSSSSSFCNQSNRRRGRVTEQRKSNATGVQQTKRSTLGEAEAENNISCENFEISKSKPSRESVRKSVPKKKGRLVGLGRRTRSVPPSSAPPPFVDPEVLTAQLKDKDDRISLLETQMAAQEAGYEA